MVNAQELESGWEFSEKSIGTAPPRHGPASAWILQLRASERIAEHNGFVGPTSTVWIGVLSSSSGRINIELPLPSREKKAPCRQRSEGFVFSVFARSLCSWRPSLKRLHFQSTTENVSRPQCAWPVPQHSVPLIGNQSVSFTALLSTAGAGYSCIGRAAVVNMRLFLSARYSALGQVLATGGDTRPFVRSLRPINLLLREI